MHHLVTCKKARPLWLACINFCRNVLGSPIDNRNIDRKIILGIDENNNLLPETVRALFRHAFGVYYAAASQTADQGTIFVWELALWKTLRSFHYAVLRCGMTIRLFNTNRLHTKLTPVPPKSSLTHFETVIQFETQPRVRFHIDPKLTTAILHAKRDAEMQLTSNPP